MIRNNDTPRIILTPGGFKVVEPSIAHVNFPTLHDLRFPALARLEHLDSRYAASDLLPQMLGVRRIDLANVRHERMKVHHISPLLLERARPN
jgi:hypothetical protein